MVVASASILSVRETKQTQMNSFLKKDYFYLTSLFRDFINVWSETLWLIIKFVR
jgi:hypothetical protein